MFNIISPIGLEDTFDLLEDTFDIISIYKIHFTSRSGRYISPVGFDTFYIISPLGSKDTFLLLDLKMHLISIRYILTVEFDTFNNDKII